MDKELPKILIIDDERFYINILVDLLSDDYNIVVTKHAEQAFSRALDLPDLILLDIQMPDYDGYEICRQLKADQRTRDIPVIFLTVKNEIDDEVKGFELGAVDYISKPISPGVVKARVATHVALNNARKNLTQQNDSLISEQILKNEQLRRSQKLEALGKLTGGIAHDFNNILGVVMGYSDLLYSSLENNESLKKYAGEVIKAAERGQKITQKLLSFSRNKSSLETIVNINHVLNEQQNMLQKTLTVSVKLILQLENDLWNTCIDKSDLEDAILNMCINSRFAMPVGGELTLKTQNILLNSQNANALQLSPAEYVVVTVTDSGTGMDSLTVSKIFDPFFTTKGEKGSGLGMSQVYGFIERSGGAISVQSVMGEGTSIQLYFPRNNQADVALDNESVAVSDYTGSESILVVDDEAALRNLIYEVLDEKGYRVLCVESAEKALEVLTTEQIDLILSDVIMPGMNGYELALIVMKKYPHVKIQIMSGFNDNSFNNEAYEKLYQKCLKKPLHASQLLAIVKDIFSRGD